MEIVKLALRNLLRQKRRTVLLGGAIAFCIMIVTVIDGFAGAFVDNLNANFADAFAGHVYIIGKEKNADKKIADVIRNDAVIMTALEDSKVSYKYISKRTSDDEANISYQGRTSLQTLTGIDFKEEPHFTDRVVLTSGSKEEMKSDPQGMLISKQVGSKLGVGVGDKVAVQTRTINGQYNLGEFNIRGVTTDSNMLFTACYVQMKYLNSLLGLAPGEYQSFGIYLNNPNDMDSAGAALFKELSDHAQVFPRDISKKGTNAFVAFLNQGKNDTWKGTKYQITTINDILPQVQQTSNILKAVGTGMLILLFIIIMVGILNTFRIIMFERIREIGTMRALGMQRKEVRNLFLFEAGFMSIVGLIFGFLLAGIVMLVISSITFPPASDISIALKAGHITFLPSVAQTILNILIVVGLTLVAASIPARNAAKLEPAAALRAVR